MIRWLSIMLPVASIVVAGTLGAAVRTGGTGAVFSYGVIDDFGSIVVNGVHYDETNANIIIDGSANQPRAALRLGMVVGIEGERDYALNTGVASVVRVNRTLLGQVESIDAATGDIRILAQRIVTDAGTRYDGGIDGSALRAGDWVAVHGLEDPGRKTLVATLIQRTVAPANLVSEIRGTVSNSHPGGFRIGRLDIATTGASPENGTYVAIKGYFDAARGELAAYEVAVTREVELRESVETEVQGYVDDYRGIDQFVIAGITVDASQASFSGGREKDLKKGVKVKVEGIVKSGLLFAEEIEFSSVSSAPKESKAELEGKISAFTSIADFVVKGRRIDASNAKIVSERGRDPAAGQKAHVKGPIDGDGVLRATSAKFEDD
jgi:hypothetical protein